MTLLDLSNELVRIGFPDMFDFQIDGDILDLENMKGSIAEEEGDIIVEFRITKLDDEENFMYTEIELTNYPTVAHIEEDFIITKFKNKLYAEELEYREDINNIKKFGQKIENKTKDDIEIYKVFDKFIVIDKNCVYQFDNFESISKED